MLDAVKIQQHVGEIRRYLGDLQALTTLTEVTEAQLFRIVELTVQIRSCGGEIAYILQNPLPSEFGPADLEFGEAYEYEHTGVFLAWEKGFRQQMRNPRGELRFPDGRKVRFFRKSTIPLEFGATRIYRYYVGSDVLQTSHQTLRELVAAIERTMPAGSIPCPTQDQPANGGSPTEKSSTPPGTPISGSPDTPKPS